MDKHEGPERRKCDTQCLESLAESYDGINATMKEINGNVKRHSGYFKTLFTRVRDLENNDIREDGVREGKSMMKASTRNLIIILLMGVGLGTTLFFGLLREIRSQKQMQMQMMQSIVNGKTETSKEDRLMTVLEKLTGGNNNNGKTVSDNPASYPNLFRAATW